MEGRKDKRRKGSKGKGKEEKGVKMGVEIKKQ
jgi:hypothetical protein